MTIHVSAKHKKIAVPPLAELVNLYPDAQYVDIGGENLILLPHHETETFLLRKLGYNDVPSPILSQYDWAGGTPFDVQRKTCAMLTMSPRAYVLNGMGTGKTKTALWAWDYLRGNNRCGKMLVVAPLSTLKFTWLREAFATLPHRKAVVLHGTKKQREKQLATPETEIFIINHDGLKVLGKELASYPDIDVMVIDELAVFRNGSADKTKAALKLAPLMKWVWGMSGGPIPTSPTDVWAQAKIVTPDNVPKYFGKFREALMLKAANNPHKWLPKVDAVERAFSVMQPSVRFTIDEVVELPECIERTIDVENGLEQMRVYKEMARACYTMVQNNEITAANAGAVMNKLLQVALGWVYTGDGRIVALDNQYRMDAIIDATMSTSRKCLVFVPFKHALAGIGERLTAEGIEHAIVSGDTPANVRNDIFSLFQNTSKLQTIAAHPQCLAHGITLTAADTVIWGGPITSLETYDQANHRIIRIGQAHKQQIIRLQSTPVERRVYGLLDRKQITQDALLKLFEDADRDD